ncbi:DUF6959 family protein [Phycicoccus mangrovi]|uniref:DUF6959 family protein n=2 Tax=Phycicoccus TaxID=367298 RepID=UPI0035572F2A
MLASSRRPVSSSQMQAAQRLRSSRPGRGWADSSCPQSGHDLSTTGGHARCERRQKGMNPLLARWLPGPSEMAAPRSLRSPAPKVVAAWEAPVMERATEIELLSPKTNRVVVRTMGRRYAGIVVQGDRLSEWVTMARSTNPEDRDELRQELEESLREVIRASEAAGIGVPHLPPI